MTFSISPHGSKDHILHLNVEYSAPSDSRGNRVLASLEKLPTEPRPTEGQRRARGRRNDSFMGIWGHTPSPIFFFDI